MGVSVGLEVLFGAEEEGVGFFGGFGTNFSKSWGTAVYQNNYNTVTKTGCVAAMPDGADSNYGFTWKLGTWELDLSTKAGVPYTVPVVGYQVSNVTRPSGVTAQIYGDVDDNGRVEIADVVMLARYLAQDTKMLVVPNPQGIANADCNGDLSLDASDLSALCLYLANMLDKLGPAATA